MRTKSLTKVWPRADLVCTGDARHLFGRRQERAARQHRAHALGVFALAAAIGLKLKGLLPVVTQTAAVNLVVAQADK